MEDTRLFAKRHVSPIFNLPVFDDYHCIFAAMAIEARFGALNMQDYQPQRLAPYFEAFIEGQIAQRKYENATEVIEDALRLLEAREAKLEQLSRALQEGLDSGEAVGFDVNEWLEAKRTAPEREQAA
jgi:antitoxin ParD1/3/4